MLRLSGALLMVAFICALTLAVIYAKTAPVIQKQQELLLENSLQSVLLADKYEKLPGEEIVYKALNKSGEVIGFCLQGTAQGYGGKIKVISGVDLKGAITGVNILEHNETPGLGSKINESRSKNEEPDFLNNSKGKKQRILCL